MESQCKIGHNRDDEFGYLYNGFNKMVETCKQLTRYMAEHSNAESRIKQLQSQINPHFCIIAFIFCKDDSLEDNANAVKFAKQLGTILSL